ncbi:UDP-glycosyltransferase 1-like [Typha latifolia]|uniref:UDP-glycosyltransferase 1-like n=1 Tax=Typha latifolia TaxID=4733 RepID=UPI003C2BEB19
MTRQVVVMNSSSDRIKPHFVLVPLMAQGHMIPMIDLALLLAERGVRVTVITTPFNASRFKTTIDQANVSGLPIRFVELPFPCAEVGLPDGCENLDVVPSMDLMLNFFEATSLLQKPMEIYLRKHEPYPNCIISDLCHPWTKKVASNLNVPRLTFFSICCFSLLCNHNISHYKAYDGITDENELIVVPGLTQIIEVSKAQAPGFFSAPGWEKLDEEVRQAELVADGIVVNSFEDLEHSYIQSYQKAMNKKVWTVGPLSLYNKDVSGMAVRGNKDTSIDANRCMAWLDMMMPRSVIYVSFGSLTHVLPSQIVELGLGLEASNRPFVWVIKDRERSDAVDEWLADGFEERVGSKGCIIKGWAPQVMILSHPAIGGFVTHCGWNSTLEGVTAGVPMVTWPHFADQFLNERMVVDVLEIGVPIGVTEPTMYVNPEVLKFVGRDDVEKAVRNLMDEGKEGEERRKRAEALGEMAREAMREGGSSHVNLTHMINSFSVNDKKSNKCK